MTTLKPSREDHPSFGLRTVGWHGVDVFGSAAAARGMAFDKLDQLALDHLRGVRA
jgi:hypothetical protein